MMERGFRHDHKHNNRRGPSRGAQHPRCCEAAFGIARQSDADRPARRVGGHFGRRPRSAESRRRRFGVATRRLRKRQEPLPLGVWRRKSPARHPGRTGSDLGSAALIQPAMRNFPEGTKMSNKTTAMWANTRVSERLGITYAKEPVMEVLLGVASKTISTYLDQI